MSKKISLIKHCIIALIFIGGAAVFLYPAISNLVNEKSQTAIIARYEENLGGMSEESKTTSVKEAQAYNESLLQSQKTLVDPFGANKEDEVNAYTFLNIGEIMGYIEVPTIGIKLPIYEGVSEDVLQKGIGWLQGTSLPVGGISTHTVLSGHRGLPTAKLFTDLDRLEVGNEFYIRNMKEIMAYKIINVQVIDPNDISALEVVKGKDLATLLTCHPYMINNQRLLVTGERTAYTGQLNTPSNDNPLENLTSAEKDFALAAVITGALLILLVLLAVRSRKKKRQGARNGRV